MTISENASVFFNGPVKDFEGPADWEGTEISYRIRVGWDSAKTDLLKKLDMIAQHKDAPKLKALVIGMWGTESDYTSAAIIQALAKRRDQLSGLVAIFLGDITYEENEISWIQNSDVTPLLQAYPNLEVIRVRGGNGLRFSQIKHDSLSALIVETGGLPRSAIREICLCEFPNLAHLELWLGSENYGWDGGIEDLRPILDGKCFPKLTYLGLRNSEIADEIAPAIVNAPVLQKLRILDLSKGNLSDAGGQALLNLSKNLPLKQLILSHHYMTGALINKLARELACEVVADEPLEPEDEWRSIMVSE